jgi:hypothetical protein
LSQGGGSAHGENGQAHRLIQNVTSTHRQNLSPVGL